MGDNENKPVPLHTSQVKVRFYDTDLSSAVFFTNQIKWFDSIAVLDFLEERGITWNDLIKENVDIPIATVTFDYKAPIFLGDVLDVTVEEVIVGNKSIRFAGSIYRHETGELLARGSEVYVFIDVSSRKAIPVPPAVRERLS